MRQHGVIGSHNRLSREAATGIEHQIFLSSLRDFAIIGSSSVGLPPRLHPATASRLKVRNFKTRQVTNYPNSFIALGSLSLYGTGQTHNRL